MKKISEGAKARAVTVDNYEEAGHGVEGDTMEAAEEEARATYACDDGIVHRLIEGVEGGDALEEVIIALRIVFLEDATPHTEPVAFVRRVMKEY